MKNFNTLSFETLANIVGGRNNWAANIGGVGGATVAGWALGNAVLLVALLEHTMFQ